MNVHLTNPYCAGQRYEIDPECHVIDFQIGKGFSLEDSLKAFRLHLKRENIEIIRYWPESDYRVEELGFYKVIDESGNHTIKIDWDTSEEYPPYLCLIKGPTLCLDYNTFMKAKEECLKTWKLEKKDTVL